MRLYDLRTEYRENPIGLTEKSTKIFLENRVTRRKIQYRHAYEIKGDR